MRYLNTLFGLLIVAAVVFAAARSQASITTSDLVPGVVNQLEDNDFEGGLLGTTPNLDVGDTLFAVFRIQELTVPPFDPTPLASDDGLAGGTTFTGLLVIDVLTKAGGPGAWTWTFGPSSAANWATVGSAPFGSGPVYVPSAGTMVAVFQDPSTPRISDTDASRANEPPSTFLWEFGFTGPVVGGVVTAAAGEGWRAAAASDLPLVVGTGAIPQGTFNLALNQTLGTDIFSQHDFLALGFGGTADLQGFGNFGNNPARPDTIALPLVSDTDLFVVPVPEFTSVVIWGGLALIATVAAYRRRLTA